MASHDELDEKHTRLTEWSEKHGVVINGVRPAVFPGKGLGIVAARHLKVGDASQQQLEAPAEAARLEKESSTSPHSFFSP